MSYSCYHWCAVPECKNTSVKTPDKLWIQVPTDINMRETWLKLARRDPKLLSEKSRLYFCEDHFNLENDMENYMRYKIMGSVKKIRLKPHCIPSRFDCQVHRKRQSVSNESRIGFVKKKRISISEEIVEDLLEKYKTQASSSSCIEDSRTAVDICYMDNECDKAVQISQIQEDKATQVVQIQDHKAIQVCRKAQYRSKQVQMCIKKKDKITSPFKFSVSTSTSPLKKSVEHAMKPSKSQSHVSRKLCFIEENCDSDTSCTPSLAGSTVDHEYSPSTVFCHSATTSDTSSQVQYKKLEKKNLQSTLSKIKNKPKMYIGLSKNLYFLIDLIKKYTTHPEHNILLCLMKIKLNRTFSQLADDFDLSVTQASNIFFNTMPAIVKFFSPLIKQFSTGSIKRNLPIAFRQNYNQVTCIIDCMEIEIQKPSKAIHQALTWSEYKKTNTIKYLISCIPDGLVNFVSIGYAGRISDVNLLEHSGFLECLQPGSCILADRGFKHLELYLSQKGFVLLRPPSVPAGFKLSKAEVKQTKQIASLRIHVERVIRRLREFGMLKLHSVINSNLIGMLDLCMTTACTLINLQDALIK